MMLKKFNTLNMANGSPAEAGTPNRCAPHEVPLYGVPPLGGGRLESTMHMDTSNALDVATAFPAKAGTPNRLKALGQLEAEIQQGMKELEGMLK